MSMMQAFLHRPTTRCLLQTTLTTATRSVGVLSTSGCFFDQQQQQKQQQQHQQHRNFSKKSPGSDPLELLRQASIKRGHCDEMGYRKKDQHWVFGIATSGPALESAPTLRTLDFQRITPSGIDFVRKRGKGAAGLVTSEKASTIICSFGKYRPGETVEQWLAEGRCEQINLVGGDISSSVSSGGRDLLSVVPSRSIVEIVASMLVKEEEGKTLEEEREPMEKHSHYMEVVQRTRNKYENGELTNEEIEKGLMGIRFVPYHMERLIGGPDQVMWERWQWERDAGEWDEPKLLLPY